MSTFRPNNYWVFIAPLIRNSLCYGSLENEQIPTLVRYCLAADATSVRHERSSLQALKLYITELYLVRDLPNSKQGLDHDANRRGTVARTVASPLEAQYNGFCLWSFHCRGRQTGTRNATPPNENPVILPSLMFAQMSGSNTFHACTHDPFLTDCSPIVMLLRVM